MGKPSGLPIMSAIAQTDSWGGKAILVRRGLVHHSVPVPGLTHLEATANSHWPAKRCYSLRITFRLSPIDPSGPDRLFRRRISGLDGWRPQRQTHAFELAAEHETGKLLHDYADENSCLIFGPDPQPPTHTTPRLLPMSWTS